MQLAALPQHDARLHDDPLARQGGANLHPAALEEWQAELLLQLLHGGAQCGLADVTGFRGAPEERQVVVREQLESVWPLHGATLVMDGKVYFASDRGVVTVIDDQAAKLTVLARNDLQESIMATPALVDGSIYVRTAGHLYAFSGP